MKEVKFWESLQDTIGRNVHADIEKKNQLSNSGNKFVKLMRQKSGMSIRTSSSHLSSQSSFGSPEEKSQSSEREESQASALSVTLKKLGKKAKVYASEESPSQPQSGYAQNVNADDEEPETPKTAMQNQFLNKVKAKAIIAKKRQQEKM